MRRNRSGVSPKLRRISGRFRRRVKASVKYRRLLTRVRNNYKRRRR